MVTPVKTVAFERLHGELEDRDKKLYRLAKARKMRSVSSEIIKDKNEKILVLQQIWPVATLILYNA